MSEQLIVRLNPAMLSGLQEAASEEGLRPVQYLRRLLQLALRERRLARSREAQQSSAAA
jgi:hypothetical protein